MDFDSIICMMDEAKTRELEKLAIRAACNACFGILQRCYLKHFDGIYFIGYVSRSYKGSNKPIFDSVNILL